MPNFSDQYGPWALVAGGSEGIGARFAHRAAAHGLNLILVARNAEALEATRQEIRSARPGVEVRTLATDLTEPAGIDAVKALTADIEVGLLIYNAGASAYLRDFLDDSHDHILHLIKLNVLGKVNLTHHFGNRMKARGHGGILLVGSMAGLAGIPGLATYSAVKAFSSTIAEALWHEMGAHGVHLASCLIGPTDTPSMRRNYPWLTDVGDDADAAAKYSLERIADGPHLYIGDTHDVAKEIATMPRTEAIQMMAKVAEPYYA